MTKEVALSRAAGGPGALTGPLSGMLSAVLSALSFGVLSSVLSALSSSCYQQKHGIRLKKRKDQRYCHPHIDISNAYVVWLAAGRQEKTDEVQKKVQWSSLHRNRRLVNGNG